MSDMAAVKAEARRQALIRRRAAHEAAGPGAADLLDRVLEEWRGVPLAGYAAMRTEIDPMPALERAAVHGPVGLPVIPGKAVPLSFRLWAPGCRMAPGEFGAPVPAEGGGMVPEVLVVPLLAFDRAGGRLGYGGGYYDRTLEALRAAGRAVAIGFAYGAQETEGLPLEPTDQPLDLIVTEREVIAPRPGGSAARP